MHQAQEQLQRHFDRSVQDAQLTVISVSLLFSNFHFTSGLQDC